jgi:hypothetical protein
MRPELIDDALAPDQKVNGYSVVEIGKEKESLGLCYNGEVQFTYSSKNCTIGTLRQDCDYHFATAGFPGIKSLRYLLGGEEKQAL